MLPWDVILATNPPRSNLSRNTPSVYSRYPLCLLCLAASLAPGKITTPAFPTVCSLFARKHRGYTPLFPARTKMKSNSSNSMLQTNRCQHRTPSGRQCLTPATGFSGLCSRHAAIQKQNQEAPYAKFLTHEASGFQTAKGINFSLANLYTLLADDRISPRRAAVLAYISSLLLRSLPAIDKDIHPHADRDLPEPPSLDRLGDASTEEATEPTNSEAIPNRVKPN